MANILTGLRIICGFIKYHEFKTVHSVLNKVCGGVAFIIPLLSENFSSHR